MTSLKYVDRFADSLFENGLETWDSSKTDGNKAQNLGGAKLYWQQNYNNNQGQIVFNNEAFRKAITHFPASLYTINRVQLDKNGNPVKLDPPIQGYRRINNSLLLYSLFDENENSGIEMRDTFLEIMKENGGTDLSSYIQVASEIKTPKIQALTKVMHRDMMQMESPLKLHACLLIAVPSGAPGSAQMWGTKNKTVKNRDSMSKSLTANDLDSIFNI